jgi:hypothetical protein
MTFRAHPHLSLMLWVILSAVAARLSASLIVGSEFRGYLVGNPVFIAVLVSLVAYTRVPARLQRRDVFAVAFTLVLFVSMGLLALFVADTSPSLARFLAGPLTSVGAYPPGPDVWFPTGATIWFVSSFGLSIACCLVGTFAAGRFRARRTR